MEWNRMVPELLVSDFSQSLAFYCDLVGFEVINKRQNPSFAYLNLKGAQLMLEEAHQGAWISAELVRPYGRGINFQIEVDDVDGIYERFTLAGHEFYRDIKESWYQDSETSEGGQREFIVLDPDGYMIRLMQHLGERPLAK